MTAYMTTTDDRETELLADALAQTYSDAVWAQVGDHLPLTDEVFKVAWYRVAERAKELGKAPKMTTAKLLDLLIAELDQLRADNRRLNLQLAAARSQRDSF